MHWGFFFTSSLLTHVQKPLNHLFLLPHSYRNTHHYFHPIVHLVLMAGIDFAVRFWELEILFSAPAPACNLLGVWTSSAPRFALRCVALVSPITATRWHYCCGYCSFPDSWFVPPLVGIIPSDVFFFSTGPTTGLFRHLTFDLRKAEFWACNCSICIAIFLISAISWPMDDDSSTLASSGSSSPPSALYVANRTHILYPVGWIWRNSFPALTAASTVCVSTVNKCLRR